MIESDIAQRAAAPPLPADADNQQIAVLKAQINLTDTAGISAYGEKVQRDVAGFADKVLRQARGKDLGETGDLLSDLISKAKGLSPAELEARGPLERFFGGLRRRVARFKAKFETVSKQIDKIGGELQKHVTRMERDIATLDSLYGQTRASIGELDAFIDAGKARIDEFRGAPLDALKQAAHPTGDQTRDMLAAQGYQDALRAVDLLEKRIFILQQARQIAVQQLPQIRIVQSGDSTLIESLRSSLTLTIPAWKQKMVLVLGISNQRETLALQTAVNDTTNELLKQASDMMKTQAFEIERQSQRGVVDIDTLARVNNDLIETIAGVVQIQQEGRAVRAGAEKEFTRQAEELRVALGAHSEA